MSDFGDDIEFDFFDEPETREDAQGQRAQRRTGGPPRRPLRPPAGFTPLLRLAGLIAFAILIVVLLVFWVQSCQGASKRSAYRKYMQAVPTIGESSGPTGRGRNEPLTTPGREEA